MIRAIVKTYDGKIHEVTAYSWTALFNDLDTTNAESIEAEYMQEEDWDERV